MSASEAEQAVPMDVEEGEDATHGEAVVGPPDVVKHDLSEFGEHNIVVGKRRRRVPERYQHPDQHDVERRAGFDEETYEEAYQSDTELTEEDTDADPETDDDEPVEEDGEWTHSSDEETDDDDDDDDDEPIEAVYLLLYYKPKLGVMFEALDEEGIRLRSVFDLDDRSQSLATMMATITTSTVPVFDRIDDMRAILALMAEADPQGWNSDARDAFAAKGIPPSELDFDVVDAFFYP